MKRLGIWYVPSASSGGSSSLRRCKLFTGRLRSAIPSISGVTCSIEKPEVQSGVEGGLSSNARSLAEEEEGMRVEPESDDEYVQAGSKFWGKVSESCACRRGRSVRLGVGDVEVTGGLANGFRARRRTERPRACVELDTERASCEDSTALLPTGDRLEINEPLGCET